jgi:hypothetical protein
MFSQNVRLTAQKERWNASIRYGFSTSGPTVPHKQQRHDGKQTDYGKTAVMHGPPRMSNEVA